MEIEPVIWILAATLASLVLLARGAASAKRGYRHAMARLTGHVASVNKERLPRRLSGVLRRILEMAARVTPERISSFAGLGFARYGEECSLTKEQLIGLRVIGTFGFPFAVLMVLKFSPSAALLTLPAGLTGFMLPLLVAERDRRRFLESARAAISGASDILYAFVLGGRNLDQAFSGTASSAPEPLRTLLERGQREMELGISRSDSFQGILSRCPIPELSLLFDSLIEAERRGHPLSDTLAIISREIRLKRRDQLRVAVAKAPLKMLAPLIFLILPASVILTVGPTLFLTLRRF